MRPSDLSKFDEGFYLKWYPDVREAVNRGFFKSGLDHYKLHGLREGRATHSSPEELLRVKLGDLIDPHGLTRLTALQERIRPISARLSRDRQPVTNVFLPTMDPQIFFGGYIAFFHFLCRLAEAGTNLRFIILEDYHGDLEGFLKEFAGRERWVRAFEGAECSNMTNRSEGSLEITEDDAIIVYSTWTALRARGAAELLRKKQMAFFIQEYEPVFHEFDSFRFLANSAYSLPHVPIFNTRALHDYFKEHRIGAFRLGIEDCISFEHNFGVRQASERGRGSAKRLLFYARPERHAGRNLFEIGVLALQLAIKEGLIDETWEVVGIGSLREYKVVLDAHRRMEMKILPRVPEQAYEQFLKGFDVGLSLMSAPHPGVVHFEWAVRGIPTVVNCTDERDSSFFAAYDLPLVPAEPTLEGIVAALAKAIGMARTGYVPSGQATRSYCASWDESFSPQFISKVMSACSMPLKRAT